MKYKTYKIKDLINEISMGPFGSNIKVECFVDSGIPVLNGSNLTGFALNDNSFRYVTPEKADSLGKANAYRGDIVITHRGTLGQIVFIPENSKYSRYVISQSQFRVKCNEKVLPEYLVYYFHTNAGQHRLLSNASQVGVPALARASTTFQTLEIDIPDVTEQRKIVDLLETIREKIELNNAINNNLEQQARLLFKSWFVDFEPFNGTMPSDWEVVPFETIVDFQNGYAFKSKELLNEPSSDCYQVFKQGHIARGGGFIPNGTKSWYPKKLASKLEKFVLKKGDILMAMTDMKDNVAILGNTAIMPIENEYIVNQRVGHLRANGYKGITYPFIYLLTNSTDFLIDLRSRANSGVQVNLSSAEIKASQTVLPSEKVNTAFSEITLSMFEAIISNQLENQRLAQLRDTLLPKLMSGELDVSDIDL